MHETTNLKFIHPVCNLVKTHTHTHTHSPCCVIQVEWAVCAVQNWWQWFLREQLWWQWRPWRWLWIKEYILWAAEVASWHWHVSCSREHGDLVLDTTLALLILAPWWDSNRGPRFLSRELSGGWAQHGDWWGCLLQFQFYQCRAAYCEGVVLCIIWREFVSIRRQARRRTGEGWVLHHYDTTI